MNGVSVDIQALKKGEVNLGTSMYVLFINFFNSIELICTNNIIVWQ